MYDLNAAACMQGSSGPVLCSKLRLQGVVTRDHQTAVLQLAGRTVCSHCTLEQYTGGSLDSSTASASAGGLNNTIPQMSAKHGSPSSSTLSSSEDFDEPVRVPAGTKRGNARASTSAAAASAQAPGQQTQMKACSKCKEVKPAATSFWRDPTKSSGYTSWCKACFNLQAEKRKAEGPVVVSERECSICKQRKPADAFMKDSRRITGLDARCRECRRAQHAARKQRNIEAGNKMWEEKECKRCHIVKPAAMFKRHAYTASGLDSWCKECCRERRKELLAQKAAQQSSGALRVPETKECGDCKVVKPASDFAKDRGQATGLSKRCKQCEKDYRRRKRQCTTPPGSTPNLSPCPSPVPGSPSTASFMTGHIHSAFGQPAQLQLPELVDQGPASAPAQLPSFGINSMLGLFGTQLDGAGVPAFSSGPLPSSQLPSPAAAAAAAAAVVAATANPADRRPASHFADPLQQQRQFSSDALPTVPALSSAPPVSSGSMPPPPGRQKQSAFASANVLPWGLLEGMDRPGWGVVSSGVPANSVLATGDPAYNSSPAPSQTDSGVLLPAQAVVSGFGLLGPPPPLQLHTPPEPLSFSAGEPSQQPQSRHSSAQLVAPQPPVLPPPSSDVAAVVYNDFARDDTLNLTAVMAAELQRELLSHPMSAATGPTPRSGSILGPTISAVPAAAPPSHAPPGATNIKSEVPPVFSPLPGMGPTVAAMVGGGAAGAAAVPQFGGSSATHRLDSSVAILSAVNNRWESLINEGTMRFDSLLGDSLNVAPARRIESLLGPSITAAGPGPDVTMTSASRDNSLLLLPPASRDTSLLLMQPASRDASLMMMLQPASRDPSLFGSHLEAALQVAQDTTMAGAAAEHGSKQTAAAPASRS